mmetsp:Transcript_2523/g.7477  ORF Transcript_2523/g.7477 Transcript_2523/m.7477 type:complete len:399 (-) Transcript_2523:152-1348(-)
MVVCSFSTLTFWYVQGGVAGVSLLILFAKFAREYRASAGFKRRSVAAFVLDCSKQVIGACWLHLANLLVAAKGSELLGQNAGPCDLYFVEIVVDTTIGVYFEYKFLQLCFFFLRVCRAPVEDFHESCVIDNTNNVLDQSMPSDVLLEQRGKAKRVQKVRWTQYLKQLLLWIVVVTVNKFAMLLLIRLFRFQLYSLTSTFMLPFHTPTLRLVTVMIIVPAVMNSLQFWLQDNVFLDVESATWEPPQENQQHVETNAPQKPKLDSSLVQELKAMHIRSYRLEIVCLKHDLDVSQKTYWQRIVLPDKQYEADSGIYQIVSDFVYLRNHADLDGPLQKAELTKKPASYVYVEKLWPAHIHGHVWGQMGSDGWVLIRRLRDGGPEHFARFRMPLPPDFDEELA